MAALEQFEAVLRHVEPAVRIVPERHIRKLLHFLRDHGRLVPHNPLRPLWVSREDLAAADVTPRTIYFGTEDPLLLLTTPDDRSLEKLPEPDRLREYWKLLFEAAVSARLERLTQAECEERLAKLQAAAIREIRFVLESEHLADPEADGAEIYRTFAAAYHVVNAFTPEAVADVFPSLPPKEEILALIGPELDIPAILERTRPAGASDAVEAAPHAGDTAAPPPPPASSAALVKQAQDADSKGNLVRAAILNSRAGSKVAIDCIQRLAHALGSVLKWDDDTLRAWRAALETLIGPAATGEWPRAARCLYELQKIPSDLSREVFAVDLVEPIRTFGRRPVKRPLPHAREVMILLKLRTAQHQLHQSGLDPHTQHDLDELFTTEMHRLEKSIRGTLAPIITSALTASGLVPANRVEEVSRDKLVAELLDRVCERGQLRFGNLRDAIARNQLKMPDLCGPVEFIAGDPLLKADTRLAYELDGIYRRGEFYLRGLQRGSSLFFGTRSGRWLFLYLIAPFLAAFLTLTFAIELKHIGGKIYTFASKTLAPRQVQRAVSSAETDPITGVTLAYSWDEDGNLVWEELDEYEWNEDGELVWNQPEPEFEWDEEDNLVFVDPDEAWEVLQTTATSTASGTGSHGAGATHDSALPQWEPVFVLGIFLLLMFHVPPFRLAFINVLLGLLNFLYAVFWTVPKRAVQSPLVVAIRYSAAARFIGRYLLAPILIAAVVVLCLTVLGASPNRLLRWGGIVLGAAFIAMNTPWGWSVQERLAESISDGWRVFRVNLLPGLIATVLEWFRRLANWVERQLYAVDEWLRFRGGDSGGSLAMKALLGLFWFPFAYLARFTFYLLIEPQVNPVKHFPVVTVSHKVILPLTPQVASGLGVSTATALWVLAGVPGVFGFIAWELLSNWKLYAANRPPKLRPAVIGSHGETMRGLLRPGFHSGTVPKLFRKLRRAEVRHDRLAASHLHHELHHVAESLERFVERELIALVNRCPGWAHPLRLEAVRFGAQRVEIVLELPESGEPPIVLAFENRKGRISASRLKPGWGGSLPEESKQLLIAAFEGFSDLAAAELKEEAERSPLTWDEWTRRWGERSLSSPHEFPR